MHQTKVKSRVQHDATIHIPLGFELIDYNYKWNNHFSPIEMRKRRLGKDEKREVTPEFVNMSKEILYPQIQGVTNGLHQKSKNVIYGKETYVGWGVWASGRWSMATQHPFLLKIAMNDHLQ